MEKSMAEMHLGCSDSMGAHENQKEAAVKLDLGPRLTCRIYGREGTYHIARDAGDIIVSVGYACWIDGRSVQETLAQLLMSFRESQMSEIKKRLIGQYVLIIKKGPKIYVFSDFLGGRNVFYSKDGLVVSSSFAHIENSLHTGASDLDIAKVLEFLAMRHILYPAWLGRSTCHRRIQWLLPYEYLVMDAENGEFRIGSTIYSIENKKHSDRSPLSSELISILAKIAARPEFKQTKVAATLTGGHDSRLVAAMASREYPQIRFRIAASTGNPRSLKDLRVARKVARIQGVPLDVFWFKPGQDDERFLEQTEGLSPAYNHTVAPLIDGAGSYSLGLGGVFGTELFMPIPWNSIDEFIQVKISEAGRALKAEDGFWDSFRKSIRGQFLEIQAHFKLTESDDRDFIRIFCLLNTARYGSFILSAFNRSGNQLDPYGSFAVFELALRIAPALWGNHKRLGGNGLIQKAAMGKLNPRMGRVMTYMHSRPMLTLSMATLPKYLIGYALQVGSWLFNRFAGRRMESQRTILPGGSYLSDGWETPFLERTAKTYQIDCRIQCFPERYPRP
jgi:hypothetical protein